MWRVCTFGILRLSFGDTRYGDRLSPTSKALISFLAMRHGKSARREELCDAIWAEDYSKKTQRKLSTLVWRLNNFRDHTHDSTRQPGLLRVEHNGNISIDCDNGAWIDLVEFESAVRHCNIAVDTASQRDIDALKRGVQLYEGEFFQGSSLEWAVEQRQYYHQCYLDMLQALIEHFSRTRQYDDVIYYADQFLRLDPYFEHIHVLLIKACLSSGRRSLAAAHAEICKRVLTTDLGIAPAPETGQLIASLLPRGSAGRQARRSSPVRSQRRAAVSLIDRERIAELRHSLSALLTVCSALLDDLPAGADQNE